MLGFRKDDRVRQMFADQFEPDGAGYLYRRNMREAAIRVSSAERDEHVAAFNRSYPWLVRGMVTAVLVLVLLVVLFTGGRGRDDNVLLYSGLAVVIAGFLVAWRMVWDAPSRSMDRRPIVGVRRTRGEVRREMLTRMTWRQLAGTGVAVVFGWLHVAGKTDLRHGWGLVWLAVGAMLAGLLMWQAGLKWRYGRSLPVEPHD